MKQLFAVITISLISALAVADRPMHPEPGKCYTKVSIPAKYRNFREKTLVREASFRTEIVPAQYAIVEEEVTVREASEKTVTIPATYKKIQERVLAAPEKRVVKPIPAQYQIRSKRILVKAEGFAWKKGKGPHQKVDSVTGEILCYTKTPAVYKTIQEKILVSEASVDEQIIPAQYKFVTKQVVDQPLRSIRKQIPALRKTVKIKKMIRDPRRKKIPLPAQYKTVTRREVTQGARQEWRSILCQTNATPQKIIQVQRKLAQSGFFKGPQTGFYGPITARSVTAFQKSRGYATGGLTEETLAGLGLSVN